MSVNMVDVIKGAIKLNGLPDRASFHSWMEFVQALPRYLSVEVPKASSGVSVSKDEPPAEYRDALWIRRDSSGGLVGVYAFQGGAWHQVYNYAPNQVIWMYGSSLLIPPGFALIETGNSRIPSTVLQGIMSHYIPAVGGGYGYFAVEFVGY
jgi:hypothetical protein